MADSTSSETPSADAQQLSPYAQNAAAEVELWAEGEASTLSKTLRLLAQPLDWLAERPEAEGTMEKVNEQLARFLDALSQGAAWTYDEEEVLERAREEQDLDVAALPDLRSASMNGVDALAKSYFSENALLSALEGGGTGLGGVALLAADVPALFTINLRLIQQIAASYGFRLEGPEARPLVVRIFSAAAADTPEARQDALEEMREAGRAAARGEGPAVTEGNQVGLTEGEGADPSEDADGTTTEENQTRVLMNELVRNLAAREMAQLIPLAGAVTGAGMNYWFTTATAQTAYMLSRTLFLAHQRHA